MLKKERIFQCRVFVFCTFKGKICISVGIFTLVWLTHVNTENTYVEEAIGLLS